MKKFEENINMKGDDTNLRGLSLQVCHNALFRNYKSDETKDLHLGPVAVNAAFMKDASLFTKVVKQTAKGFDERYYLALGELICLQDPVVQEHE